MSNQTVISNFEIEQMYFKELANLNSEYLKKHKKRLGLKEANPEIVALDEFMLKLQRGEYIVNKDNSLEKLIGNKVKLPDLGEVTVYETEEVAQNRKQLAYEEAVREEKEEEFKSSGDNIDPTNTRQTDKKRAHRYSAIIMQTENGKSEILIIDDEGHDVGIAHLDEKGQKVVDLELAPEVEESIDSILVSSDISNFYNTIYDPKVIKKEFYPKDFETLLKAIDEGKLIPETTKAAYERAQAATHISQGEYTQEDLDVALTSSPEEIEYERSIKAEAKERMEEDEGKENLEKVREISEENTLIQEAEEADLDKGIKPEEQPKLVRTDRVEDKDTKEDSDENMIPDDKKDEVEEACNTIGVEIKEVKAVLIIKDSQAVHDALGNDDIIPEKGEVTAIQFSDATTGKDRYILSQPGQPPIYREANDEALRSRVEPYKMTTGIIEKAPDETFYVDYTVSTGKTYTEKVQRVPNDLSKGEKDAFKIKLDKDVAKLESIRRDTPNDIAEIDRWEKIVCKDFEELGLPVPIKVKEDAEREGEPENTEEAELEEQEEQEKSIYTDDDFFDENGRRILPR